jgi:hypothetical protein
MQQFLSFFALVALLAVSGSQAFVQQGASNAFGVQKSSSALHMTALTYNGKKKDFKAGSKLSAACSGLGVKPRYNCKK